MPRNLLSTRTYFYDGVVPAVSSGWDSPGRESPYPVMLQYQIVASGVDNALCIRQSMANVALNLTFSPNKILFMWLVLHGTHVELMQRSLSRS